MAEADEERTSFQVSRTVLKRFKAVCDSQQIGRPMFDVGNRLLVWFCDQTPLLRTAITNYVDEGMELEYADALLRMARDLRGRHRQRRGEPGPPRTFPEQLIHDVAAENGVAPAVAHSIITSYFFGMAGPRNPPNHEPHIVIEGPMPPANPKPPPPAAAPQRRRR